MGESYLARFKLSGKKEDIDFAIKQQLEAVSSALPAYRRSDIHILGHFYLLRFQRFWELKDIGLAIENLMEAVVTAPPDSSARAASLLRLGLSYLSRYISNRELTDLEESISNFRLSSLSLKGLPSTRIKASLLWARMAQDLNNLESASEAYDQALRFLPQVAWIGLDAIARLKRLKFAIETLGCYAAACMIALAQAASEHHDRQHHLGRAIELLYQGRSILWSQTSNLKRDLDGLREVDSNLASGLDNVGKFLAQGCFRDPNEPFSETDAQLYRRYAEVTCSSRSWSSWFSSLLTSLAHFYTPKSGS